MFDPSLTLHSPLTQVTLKQTRDAKEAKEQVAPCSQESIFLLVVIPQGAIATPHSDRGQRTLIPQGADWQSVGQGPAVCINEIPAKLK